MTKITAYCTERIWNCTVKHGLKLTKIHGSQRESMARKVHPTEHKSQGEKNHRLREEFLQTYEQRRIREDNGKCTEPRQCEIGSCSREMLHYKRRSALDN